MFISKWKVYVYDLKTFRDKIDRRTKEVNLRNVSVGVLFYDHFKCNQNYSKDLNLREEEFRELYLETLPEYHDSRVWHRLITSSSPYG